MCLKTLYTETEGQRILLAEGIVSLFMLIHNKYEIGFSELDWKGTGF